MVEVKKLLLNRVRLALLLAIVAVNIGGFSVGRAEAAESCERCGWVPGGIHGWYADCIGSGNISLCWAAGWNFCKGYTCGSGGYGEEEEFEVDEPFPY